ncbi:MAG: hypothetical protein Fur0037_21180 [Planctomycetota bacterium]
MIGGMKALISIAVLFVPALPLGAQANDWAGISLRVTGSTTGSASSVSCGSAFTCTADAGLPEGRLAPLLRDGNLPGVLHAARVVRRAAPRMPFARRAVPGERLDPVAGGVDRGGSGTCTVPDNGRRNGGASPSTLLLQSPLGIPPGRVAFQALVSSPLSAGGTGLAFSRAVVVTYN